MAFLGEDIRKLGFGLMRPPMLEGGAIDYPQLEKMVDMFLERGFTYFDTAYGYVQGESEVAAGKTLVQRHPRESFQLATKLPAWAGANTEEEAKAMFFTSLERTGAGYFDFYLLHNLGATRTDSFYKYHIWEFVAEQKAKGLIKHVGFSFHDTADKLDEILAKHHAEVEFVQLQINYADWESGGVQSRKCHEVAWVKYGKPVVIMEPIKGGMLANPVEGVKNVFDSAGTGASYSSWAIRFAASLPGVITVLSGMSTLEQMDDNTSYMQDFKPLSADESALVVKAREVLASVPQVQCTGCDYCRPECPQKIAIPSIFDAMNRKYVFQDEQSAKFGYMWGTGSGGKASDCLSCGLCEAVCPQKIEIINTLKDAVAMFETE